MAKAKQEEINFTNEGFDVDDSIVEVHREIITPEPIKETKSTKKTKVVEDTPLVSCLRNERVIVRHIPKERGGITNPKHVLYGGMAETATRTFVVPRLSSGLFVNVLTDSEKAFLEEVMGLEYNALSSPTRDRTLDAALGTWSPSHWPPGKSGESACFYYKKVDNFWDDSNESGISRVRLSKQDNFLNLADPEDYIRYKILLANKEYIAPSLQALQDTPKATYQFVIISDGEEVKSAKDNMSATMKCYKEYGKIEDDIHTLRVIVETIEGKPTSASVKLEFLQTRINNLIQADSKTFLRVITDPMLPTKVLIKRQELLVKEVIISS